MRVDRPLPVEHAQAEFMRFGSEAIASNEFGGFRQSPDVLLQSGATREHRTHAVTGYPPPSEAPPSSSVPKRIGKRLLQQLAAFARDLAPRAVCSARTVRAASFIHRRPNSLGAGLGGWSRLLTLFLFCSSNLHYNLQVKSRSSGSPSIFCGVVHEKLASRFGPIEQASDAGHVGGCQGPSRPTSGVGNGDGEQ